jgi:hypothetical protein
MFSLLSPGGDVDEAIKIGTFFRKYLIHAVAPTRGGLQFHISGRLRQSGGMRLRQRVRPDLVRRAGAERHRRPTSPLLHRGRNLRRSLPRRGCLHLRPDPRSRHALSGADGGPQAGHREDDLDGLGRGRMARGRPLKSTTELHRVEGRRVRTLHESRGSGDGRAEFQGIQDRGIERRAAPRAVPDQEHGGEVALRDGSRREEQAETNSAVAHAAG